MEKDFELQIVDRYREEGCSVETEVYGRDRIHYYYISKQVEELEVSIGIEYVEGLTYGKEEKMLTVVLTEENLDKKRVILVNAKTVDSFISQVNESILELRTWEPELIKEVV